MSDVATFVIETYLPRARALELADATTKLRAAASDASTPDGPVRHIRSFFIPEDELCFHVLEAPAPEAILEVSRRAGLIAERIVEAVT